MSRRQSQKVGFLAELKEGKSTMKRVESGRKLTSSLMHSTKKYSQKKLKAVRKMLPRNEKELEEMMGGCASSSSSASTSAWRR